MEVLNKTKQNPLFLIFLMGELCLSKTVFLKIWHYYQKHLHHLKCTKMQILGPHHRLTESEILGVVPRNMYFKICSCDSEAHSRLRNTIVIEFLK